MLPTVLIISWLAMPMLLWGAMLCVRRHLPVALVWVLCLASVTVGVFLLANYVWALDAKLLAEVDKYQPGTPEAQRASEEWASDTGRSFLLLLSPVVTAIWYGVLFALLFGLQRCTRRMNPAANAPVDSSGGSAILEQ